YISNPPRQRFVEATSELQIVGSANHAVAVEIEVRLVSATNGLVEGSAEGQIVAGVDDGLIIHAGSAARRRGRRIRVAEEAVERGRRIGGHVDAGNAIRMHFGRVDVQVVNTIHYGIEAVCASFRVP